MQSLDLLSCHGVEEEASEVLILVFFSFLFSFSRVLDLEFQLFEVVHWTIDRPCDIDKFLSFQDEFIKDVVGTVSNLNICQRHQLENIVYLLLEMCKRHVRSTRRLQSIVRPTHQTQNLKRSNNP